MGTKEIVNQLSDQFEITEKQKEAIAQLLETIWKEGYVAARTTAVNAFDEMWLGTEEEPTDDHFEPDMDYHRRKFIDAFMW